jgi:hypothetical protein
MSGLAPGTEFAGHRIDSVAGRGGMGVVYRATQMALERVVALKLIVPELADDPGLRERFERESRIAASIDHPNVLPLYYAGEHEGVLFQAMRYVDGTAPWSAPTGPCLRSGRSGSSRRSPPRSTPPTRTGSSTGMSSRPT